MAQVAFSVPDSKPVPCQDFPSLVRNVTDDPSHLRAFRPKIRAGDFENNSRQRSLFQRVASTSSTDAAVVWLSRGFTVFLFNDLIIIAKPQEMSGLPTPKQHKVTQAPFVPVSPLTVNSKWLADPAALFFCKCSWPLMEGSALLGHWLDWVRRSPATTWTFPTLSSQKYVAEASRATSFSFSCGSP